MFDDTYLKKQECAGVFIPNDEMTSSTKERDFGDFVTNQANSNENLIARNGRAHVILTEIRELASEIPLGKTRFEKGIHI